MSIPTLGQLIEVDLREAWSHEAQSFTPWLAQHLDQLADKLGIELELIGIEVKVDTFSADILAQDPQNETQVLIENQLEVSDHNHLGQIMTYLAGLDAKTVVWIARDFREAHLSALNWLNQNTSDDFSFFAVRVKAVRIGESPIAPVFDVLGRPNNWERALHKIADDNTGKSEMHKKRLSFWRHFVGRHPDQEKYCAVSGASHRWRRLETLGLTVVCYLANECVGVYVRGMKGADSTEVFERLSAHEPELTAKLGPRLGSENGKHFFVSKKHADTDKQEMWSELCDWLKATSDNYESVLRECFRPLDPHFPI